MVGRRMPDVDCGGTRLYELLREGRFVMATTADVEIDRTDVVHAVHRDRELPPAVLVRPDGYVAWADDEPPTNRTPLPRSPAGACGRLRSSEARCRPMPAWCSTASPRCRSG
jgi:hypothetical protein